MTASTDILWPPSTLTMRVDANPRALQAKEKAVAHHARVGELYDLYSDDVFGLALWLLGSREEAADTVQDTFVRLMTWRGSLQEIREPRAFLLRAARTAALDRIRKRRPVEPLPEESLLASAADNPEARARAGEVSRAVRSLPPKQREVVYLRSFVGLTFREIGGVAGVPTFTAASRFRLAMRRLEQQMNPGR